MAGKWFPFTGQAAASVEEKPLAGITLSIDRYCESVLENLKEDAEQAKKEASRDEASDDTVILSNVSEKEKQEKKEREERIELNLKYDKLGIANVDTYLNVRKRGSESAKIIGKMTKNTGIMTLLVFSILLAPRSRVSRVPTTTMMWKGSTE